MFVNFIYIPDATPTIQSINNFATPWFQGLLPITYVEIGLTLGSMAIAGLLVWLTYLFIDLFAHRDRGDGWRWVKTPDGGHEWFYREKWEK